MRFFTLFLLLVSLRLDAQQTPQYSLYMLNQFGWNPARAGADNSLSITGIWRSQWNGLAGAPQTQQVNAHLPLQALQSGLGIWLENDATGPQRMTAGQFAWTYRLETRNGTLISAGLSGGFSQFTLDGNLLKTPDGNYVDPAQPIHNDPILPTGRESVGAPVFGAGLFIVNKKLEVGLAAQQLLEPRWSFAQNLTIQSRRTLTGMVARPFNLTDDLVLKPSILLKTDLSEWQMEASAMGQFRENWLGGLSFRGFSGKNRDALVLFVGTRLNDRTRVAYAWDWSISALGTANRGSHELLLNYNLGRDFGKGRLPAVIYNPRFQ